jgi:PEGA domain/TPR repeat
MTTPGSMLRKAALTLVLSTAFVPQSALADQASEVAKTPKERARQHFAEGIESYDRGDYEAAIASYQKAFVLVPYPVIAFNIGLAYEKLGKPVEAVATMKKVLADPGTMRPQRIEQARSTLETQGRLVAELQVSCNVEGASLRLNGREIGTLPMQTPLPVAAGKISLMATKDGYQAGYARLTALGGKNVPVSIDLAEAAQRPAQVEIQTTLPGAELYVDGQLVARTPLRGTIPLVAGKAQRLELRREGYVTASETLTLSEGASASVSLQPQPNAEALAMSGGELILRLAQSDASVFVDGKRREIGQSGRVRLPAGLHTVVGDRDGYDSLNLRVEIPVGGSIERTVDLIPTPQTRAALIGDAEFDQGLGWGLTIGGAVFTGVAAGVLGWSIGQRSDAQSTVDAINNAQPPYEFCDGSSAGGDTCIDDRGAAATLVDRHTIISVGAGIGVAGGVAALTTGIIYLATGEDPDQYRLKLDDDVFALRATPSIWAAPGQGAVGFTGRF